MAISRENVEALLEADVISEITEGTIKQSKALSMFRRLPNMSSGKTKMKILDALPLAYWVDADTNNGRKGITKQAWANKYITAEEIAVIIPIKEDLLDDVDFDIWADVKPRVVEAFGRKIDEAVFVGVDKPKNFRMDLLSSVRNAGATVTQASDETLYSAINNAMVKVEESGYNVTGIVGGVDLKGKFRMMLDTTGQPIKGTEIGDLSKAYIDNGAWDKTKSQLIVGDMSQAVYSIRQDITYKVLDQAVIQDPSTGEIMYNLAQEDMVALRVVMRLGWEIPNPVNALNPDEATRFPFASIDPTTAPTTHNVTFTVTNGETKVAGAKVTLSGQSKATDANGTVVFACVPGKYTYTVKKTGAKSQTGETVVENKAVAVAIQNFA